MLGTCTLCLVRSALPSGGGGCAAHRPPHQKVRRKCVGKAQERCYCVHKSIRAMIRLQSARRSKRLPKHTPEGLQNPPWDVPKPLKSRPRVTPGAKMHPGGVPDQPRDAQERPKIRPRGAQEDPRGVHLGAQKLPKSIKNRNKMNIKKTMVFRFVFSSL